MKIKELMLIIDSKQELVIVIDKSAAGFYRCTANDITPAMRDMSIRKIYPHHNGAELVIETER